MTRLVRSNGKRSVPRTRGRPSLEAAAGIDREILHAARELFLRHGFERTSMAMVIKAAGVSKTTLYTRYATKADMFRATVLLTVERIANQTLSPAERDAYSLAEGLRVFGRGAMRTAMAPLWSGYERLVYTEGPRFPELVDGVAERIDLSIQTVSRFISHCAERDGFQVHDPDGVGMTYIMALRGFYARAALRGQNPTEGQIDAFVDRLVDLLLAARESW
jgi:AcrR family transcriptional regulator